MNYLGFSPLYIIILPIITLLGTIVGSIVNGWFQGRNQRRTNSGRFDTATAGELLNRTDRLENNMMQRIEAQAKQIEKQDLIIAKLQDDYYKIRGEREDCKLEISDLKEEVEKLTNKISTMCIVCPYMPNKEEAIS